MCIEHKLILNNAMMLNFTLNIIYSNMVKPVTAFYQRTLYVYF